MGRAVCVDVRSSDAQQVTRHSLRRKVEQAEHCCVKRFELEIWSRTLKWWFGLVLRSAVRVQKTKQPSGAALFLGEADWLVVLSALAYFVPIFLRLFFYVYRVDTERLTFAIQMSDS